MGVIALLTNDHTILNHYLVHAAAAAVVTAGSAYPLAALLGIGDGGVSMDISASAPAASSAFATF